MGNPNTRCRVCDNYARDKAAHECATSIIVRVNWKRYGLYLARWQLSTPLIALVMYALAGHDYLLVTAFANIIGGLIFFWVERNR